VDGSAVQFFQEAVGEGGSARASAGEGDDDEEVIGIVGSWRNVAKAIAGVGIKMGERGIGGVMSAAGGG